MDFVTAIKTVFGKYVDFNGRALRSEFWYFQLFMLIVSAVVNAVFEPLGIVVGLAVLLPNLAVGARRLHDTGRSGWWQLLLLLPVIGVIVLIVWWATKGEPGDNRFGPAPVPRTAN
jgi:uncharacterized membrane protein YhaH (DUF805 family)